MSQSSYTSSGAVTAYRRFRLRSRAAVRRMTVSGSSTVALAVLNVLSGTAHLVEYIEKGRGEGRSWMVILDLDKSESVVTSVDHEQARRAKRDVQVIVRYLKLIFTYDDYQIELREFEPPLERHVYVFVAERDWLKLSNHPSWLGEEVTHDSRTDPYRIAVDEHVRRKRESDGK